MKQFPQGLKNAHDALTLIFLPAGAPGYPVRGQSDLSRFVTISFSGSHYGDQESQIQMPVDTN